MRRLQSVNADLLDSHRAALNVLDDAIAARREAEQANAELRTANDTLSRFNRAAVDRELRMVQLKKQVNELCAALGQPPKHNLAFADDTNPTPND